MNTSAPCIASSSVRSGSFLGEFLLVGIQIATATVNHALGIHQGHVVLVRAHGDQQAHARQPGGTGAEAHQFGIGEVLALQFQRVEQAGADDDGGAVLVVMKHRYIQSFLENTLDLETVRRGDVFQVDAAESGRDVDHGFDEGLDAGRIDLDVEHIDIGEALEQHRLTLHHRLGSQRAEIAEAENRRSVGNHRHQVALVGVAVGIFRIPVDLAHRLGHARCIGQRQFRRRAAGLGRLHRELARLGKLVIIQCALFQVVHADLNSIRRNSSSFRC